MCIRDRDFITDMHNYVGILRAVANGQQTMGEISARTGLDGSKASFYLSVLRDTGFVRRDVPISQRGQDSRRGRYVVTDPYLRFFYRFISAHQSKLALGQTRPVMQQLEESLAEFLERNTWLELCRDWTLLAGAHEALPVSVDDVGAEWAASYTCLLYTSWPGSWPRRTPCGWSARCWRWRRAASTTGHRRGTTVPCRQPSGRWPGSGRPTATGA